MLLLSFNAGVAAVTYVLVQIAALGAVIWAGRLLNWGAFRVLLYFALAILPMVNWIALGDIHRSLGKKLKAVDASHAAAYGNSATMIAIIVFVVGCVVREFAGNQVTPTRAANDGPSASAPPHPLTTEKLEAELTAMLTEIIAGEKQDIFNALHPTGNATGVKVHEAKVTKWRKDVVTNRPDDIAEFVVRYTIYWEGPVTRDGYTKVAQTYDAEVGRYTRCEILSTNGITNDEAAQAAGLVFGMALRHAIDSAAAQ